MAGLWADGWFYISSAGLLVSGVLFFFLLGQYRVASEALDTPESEQSDIAVASVSPVIVHDEPVVAPIASVSTAKAADVGSDKKDPANTTGGLRPAVEYLQNIKIELVELHQEIRALAKRVDVEINTVSSLAGQLNELAGIVKNFPQNATLAAPVASESEPQAAPVLAPVTKTEEPVQRLDETIRLERSPVVESPLAEPAGKKPEEKGLEQSIELPQPSASTEAPLADAPASDAKPRRGPVWPV